MDNLKILTFYFCFYFIKNIMQGVQQKANGGTQSSKSSSSPNKIKQLKLSGSIKNTNITKHKSLQVQFQQEVVQSQPTLMKIDRNNCLSQIYEQNQFVFGQMKKKDQADFKNYLFQAIDEDNNIYKFDLREWTYFSKGADHVVYHNINNQSQMADKVLIFKKVPVSYVDEQIFNHYMKDLMKDQIQKYLAKGIKIWPRTKQFEKVLSLLKQKKKQIDFSTAKFTISTNVFFNINRKWDIILQFKPKSLMPSKYAEQTIKNISENYQISQQTLKKQIGKADIIQKLTWFKKVTCSGKKITLCPLQIYADIKYQCNQLDYTKTQLYKQYTEQFQPKFINQLITQTLKKYSVRKNIHKIMGVYNLPNLYGISQQIHEAEQLPVALPQIISTSKQLFPIEKTAEFLTNQDCLQSLKFKDLQKQSLQEKWERFYRLLVFRCWNDISLVVKISLDQKKQSVVDTQISILDFQLWHTHTVQNRTTSEKQYLRRYLQYKGLINNYSRQNHNSIMENRQYLKFKNQSFQIGFEIINDFNQTIQIHNHTQFVNSLPKLSKIINLKYLYLDKNNLQKQDIQLLISSQHLKLSILSLDSNRIEAQGCIQLAKGNWPNLLLLNINSNNIRNQGLKSLTNSNWDKLQQISLDWNQINENGIFNLNHWKNLTKICLTFCKISYIGAKSLIQGKHKKLKQLSLYNNSLKANGLIQLFKGEWPLLQQLNLSKTQLSKQGCPDISFSRWPKLKSLDLSINNVMSFNSEVLKKMNLANIQELKLCYNKIKVEGIKVLVQIQFKCLRKLDLYFNKIKDPGLEVFCSKTWLNLEELNFTRNDITDFGVSHFKCENFPKLYKLFLYHNKISLKGVKIIMDQAWPKLKMVDVAQNGINVFSFKKNYNQISSSAKIAMQTLVLD